MYLSQPQQTSVPGAQISFTRENYWMQLVFSSRPPWLTTVVLNAKPT